MEVVSALLLPFVLVVLSNAVEPVEAPPETGTTGEITLAEAAARALIHNPRLATFSWDVRAAEARELQAGLRPNPELTIEAEEVRLTEGPRATSRGLGLTSDGTLEWNREKRSGPASGFREAEFTISLAQLFELGGKRARRVDLAQRERELVEWDYEAARVAVLTEVAQRFVDVLAAQERLALADAMADLAERQTRTEADEVEAGVESPLSLLRSETQRDSVALDRDRAVRELDAARAALAATWGETEPRFERAVGVLGDVTEPAPYEELELELERNPDLARWATEFEHRRAALRLARAQAVPDITVAAGVRLRLLEDSVVEGGTLDSTGAFGWARGRDAWDDEVDTTFVLAVTMPLPVFDRNPGGILEAEHLVAKAEDERRAVQAEAGAALYAAYQVLEGARHEAERLRDVVLPRAEVTLARTQEGHRLGKLPYRDVLDAERMLNEIRIRYVEARAEYHAAATEIYGLVGRPVANRPDSPPPLDEDALP